MNIAYMAQTESSTLMLDAAGVCLRVQSRQGRDVKSDGAVRCIGAQYVASLALTVHGGLVERPTIGCPMLFAATDVDGRIYVVRTGALVRFEEVFSGVHHRHELIAGRRRRGDDDAAAESLQRAASADRERAPDRPSAALRPSAPGHTVPYPAAQTGRITSSYPVYTPPTNPAFGRARATPNPPAPLLSVSPSPRPASDAPRSFGDVACRAGRATVYSRPPRRPTPCPTSRASARTPRRPPRPPRPRRPPCRAPRARRRPRCASVTRRRARMPGFAGRLQPRPASAEPGNRPFPGPRAPRRARRWKGPGQNAAATVDRGAAQ